MRYGLQAYDLETLKVAMGYLPQLGDRAFIELVLGRGVSAYDPSFEKTAKSLNAPIEVVALPTASSFATSESYSPESEAGRRMIVDGTVFVRRLGASKLVLRPAVYEIKPKYETIHEGIDREDRVEARALDIASGLNALSDSSGIQIALEHDLRPIRFPEVPDAEDIFHTSRIYPLQKMCAAGVGICLNSALADTVNNLDNVFRIAEDNLMHVRLSDFRENKPDLTVTTGFVPGEGLNRAGFSFADLLCRVKMSCPDMTVTLEVNEFTPVQAMIDWLKSQPMLAPE